MQTISTRVSSQFACDSYLPWQVDFGRYPLRCRAGSLYFFCFFYPVASFNNRSYPELEENWDSVLHTFDIHSTTYVMSCSCSNSHPTPALPPPHSISKHTKQLLVWEKFLSPFPVLVFLLFFCSFIFS